MQLKMDMPDDATQCLTVYMEMFGDPERPVATLQRRRVYENGPAWRIYDTDGEQIGRIWRTRDYVWLHERVIAIVRADLASKLERGA